MRRLVRLCLAAAVVIVILLVVLYLLGERGRARYEARVAALRAAGEPTRYEDLAPPPVPDEGNAALLLAEADGLLREVQQNPDANEFLDVGSVTPEEHAQLRAYLDSLGAYFVLLEEIPRRPGWHVERAWEEGPGAAFDEIAWIQRASRHLLLRVALDASGEGRSERAARSALLLLDIAERCPVPGMIGYLVAETLTSTYPALILRAAAERSDFDAARFRSLVAPRLMQATPEAIPPRTVFAQERVLGLWIVDTLGAGRRGEILAEYLPLGGRVHSSFVWRPFLYRDAQRMLDVFETVLASAGVRPEEALRVAGELRAKLRESESRWNPVRGFATILPRSFETSARCAAIRRLACVTLALLAHHRREGSWPASLAGLDHAPVDPLGGGSFRYERTQEGVRIGAAGDAPWEELEDDDLAWRLADGCVVPKGR